MAQTKTPSLRILRVPRTTAKPAVREAQTQPSIVVAEGLPALTRIRPPEPDDGALEVHTVSLPFVLRGPTDRRRKLLTTAIVGSVLLHVIVLVMRFSPFDFSKIDRNTPPLEVALVNAKSVSKPTKAEILAQANLDGGGNTDAARRAKSPLPVLPRESTNTDLTVATQKVDELEREAKELMTQIKSGAAVETVAPKPTEALEKPELPTSNEMMQRTLELMRLEAQIDKQMDAYQKRPKRRFIGARAQEYRFARYVEDWRMKVEQIGNRNYPDAARQQKLYGSLQVSVSIRADGSLEKVEVDRSSGQKILDAAAVRVVEMAAPYMAFPENIRRDTDILTITRTWSFVNGDSLVTK